MATSEGIPSSIDIEFLELNDNPYINLYALLLTFCHESQELHRTVSCFKFLCHNLSLLILSYLVKRLHKIITHKYTTGIDVSSDIDGVVFSKRDIVIGMI